MYPFAFDYWCSMNMVVALTICDYSWGLKLRKHSPTQVPTIKMAAAEWINQGQNVSRGSVSSYQERNWGFNHEPKIFRENSQFRLTILLWAHCFKSLFTKSWKEEEEGQDTDSVTTDFAVSRLLFIFKSFSHANVISCLYISSLSEFSIKPIFQSLISSSKSQFLKDKNCPILSLLELEKNWTTLIVYQVFFVSHTL